MPVDAEAWLRARNVARQPLWSTTSSGSPAEPARTDLTGDHDVVGFAPSDLADDESVADDTSVGDDLADVAELPEDARKALAFIRRSTMRTPQATARIREKLAQRGFGATAIDDAVRRATREGIVDDDAIAHALVDEARRKGHGQLRIRQDLTRRGFDRKVVERQLAPFAEEDPYAAAFEVARHRAQQLSSEEPQHAYRRVVGYVARRGYPESIARKVARDAVFAQRESEWNASR